MYLLNILHLGIPEHREYGIFIFKLMLTSFHKMRVGLFKLYNLKALEWKNLRASWGFAPWTPTRGSTPGPRQGPLSGPLDPTPWGRLATRSATTPSAFHYHPAPFLKKLIPPCPFSIEARGLDDNKFEKHTENYQLKITKIDPTLASTVNYTLLSYVRHIHVLLRWSRV